MLISYMMSLLITKLFKIFLKFEFTPCKAEESLQVMELQEKEAQKD